MNYVRVAGEPWGYSLATRAFNPSVHTCDLTCRGELDAFKDT